jgi:hypothetical protein
MVGDAWIAENGYAMIAKIHQNDTDDDDADDDDDDDGIKLSNYTD